jgi:hypothetical protein
MFSFIHRIQFFLKDMKVENGTIWEEEGDQTDGKGGYKRAMVGEENMLKVHYTCM